MAQKKQSGRSTSSKRKAPSTTVKRKTPPKQTKRTNAGKTAGSSAKRRTDKSTKRKTNESSKTSKQLSTVRTSRGNAGGQNTQSRARAATQSDFAGMTSITVNDHTFTVNGSKKFIRTAENVKAVNIAMSKRKPKSVTVRY